MITQFRPIKGFKGEYEIDNDGNVKSLKRNKMLKHGINTNGYKQVELWKNNKPYPKLVHRLVAEAFLPNPLVLPCVNHKDENKLNNRVWINEDGSVDYEKTNLEWCTYKYNNNYGSRNERIAVKQRGIPKSEEHKAKMRGISRPHVIEQNKRLKSKPVVAVDEEGNVVMEFPSAKEAGRNGFNFGHVSECCRNCYMRNGNRFFKGYYWFWKKDWEEMQKEKAKPHKRELPYQLSLQFD